MAFANSPKNVLSARARLGEGPLWDAQRQVLHWVDVYNRRVHTFDPATASDTFIEVETVVSGLFLVANEYLILAQEHGLGRLDLSSQQVEPIVEIEAELPNNRLNDVRCDSQGRLWIGTMNNDEQPTANLYRYDSQHGLKRMETGLSISNGLGWSPDQQTFYLTDTPRKTIYAYRFDVKSGEISDRQAVVSLAHEPFYPDGLAIDTEGCIWSAMWNGSCVIRFDAAGHEIARVSLPVPLVTSCAFGGPELTDLYITTASAGLSQADLKQYYQAGDLFCLSTGIKGLPSDRYGHH